jgi:uncharacterized protein with GYD domain
MKVFFLAAYSDEGLAGLMKSSYAVRKEAMKKMAEGAGGKLNNITFLQGHYDVLVEMELDSVETASVRLSGAIEDLMMMPEFNIDKSISVAAKVGYASPGQE